jgi:hypothetical protein
MLCRVLFLALLTVANLTAIVSAQVSPDSNGDYYRNDAPARAVRSANHLTPGSLWQVVAVGLNCRSAPGTQQAIVRQFWQGDILQVNIGRGGSDEVFINPSDRNGKPWLPVRTEEALTCYVRANDRYIQPLNP